MPATAPMTLPKFPFGLSVWTNAAGILRPDEANGRSPWLVIGIRRDWELDEANEYIPGEFLYLLGSASRPDYGWVSEWELEAAGYAQQTN